MAAPQRPTSPSVARTPRGIRNNNPGNIRWQKGVTWQGQAKDRTDSEFVVFDTPEWGIRALIRVLLSYKRRGVVTPAAIINRWAPPKGQAQDGRAYTQNTGAYVRSISAALGVGADAVIDVESADTLRLLLPAIIQHENGQQPYAPEVLERAMELANIETGRA
jgi:hypothetical protein